MGNSLEKPEAIDSQSNPQDSVPKGGLANWRYLNAHGDLERRPIIGPLGRSKEDARGTD